MDSYYFLINIVKHRIIRLDYFKICKNIYNYPICFTSNNSDLMVNLLSLHNAINLLSTDHILYLGKEVCKAELSVFCKQSYVQD
uniref:DUF4346 domain-containing protein n=1 Tax=Dipterocladia arabiensis TaxID=2007176 RepID=A0A1Z1M0F4_9FLOR|nr:hypothetical protein [Dipterocladia arabiensis]ARW59350.1 hypothetical protein [Dipterocladia arabiensis]